MIIIICVFLIAFLFVKIKNLNDKIDAMKDKGIPETKKTASYIKYNISSSEAFRRLYGKP